MHTWAESACGRRKKKVSQREPEEKAKKPQPRGKGFSDRK
jgi:hypothetical protein